MVRTKSDGISRQAEKYVHFPAGNQTCFSISRTGRSHTTSLSARGQRGHLLYWNREAPFPLKFRGRTIKLNELPPSESPRVDMEKK